jgi:hypothetical protein
MIGHLRGLPPVLRAIAGCDAASALPITVRVLLHDSAQRDRLLRHVAETLRHCAAALGDPADACAVVVVRELEREGRPLKGCVERLSYPDGTCRAIVSLPLSEGGRPLTLDEIAARLVRYYPALIARRTGGSPRRCPIIPAVPAASATRIRRTSRRSRAKWIVSPRISAIISMNRETAPAGGPNDHMPCIAGAPF